MNLFKLLAICKIDFRKTTFVGYNFRNLKDILSSAQEVKSLQRQIIQLYYRTCRDCNNLQLLKKIIKNDSKSFYFLKACGQMTKTGKNKLPGIADLKHFMC